MKERKAAKVGKGYKDIKRYGKEREREKGGEKGAGGNR